MPEILRYAQNDRKLGAQNDRSHDAQNDREEVVRIAIPGGV